MSDRDCRVCPLHVFDATPDRAVYDCPLARDIPYEAKNLTELKEAPRPCKISATDFRDRAECLQRWLEEQERKSA